jgi:hypothetical protein
MTGEVLVLFGGAGLSGEIDLGLSPPDVLLYPPSCGDWLGASVVAGDWDGDTIDDLWIGAPGGDGPGEARPEAGEVFVVLGGPGLGGTVDLSATTPLLTIFGAFAGERLGGGLSSGDVNGDRRLDLIALSERQGPAGNRTVGGSAYAIPAPSPARTFTVLRALDDPTVLAPFASPAGSPWDDPSGSLQDGSLYFYRLSEDPAPEVLLAVGRNLSLGTLRLSWDDGVPGAAVTPDPASTLSTAAPTCSSTADLSGVEVRVFPRDADGESLGRGLTLSWEPGLLPAVVAAGGFEDLGNGAYRGFLHAAAEAQVDAAVLVEGVFVPGPDIVFSGAAPEAALDVSAQSARLGETITFTGSASGGAPPYRFDWDLDGDGVLDAAGADQKRAYARTGSYSVSLRVTDAGGCSAAAAVKLAVSP